ncbi:MAG TPA: PPC domain-containing protein [Gemmataceae bacterium]|nr:PPC domain-containing protein [Gemmataceae bacterium]
MLTHLSSAPAARRALAVLLPLLALWAGNAQAQQMISSNLPAPRLMTVMPPGGQIGSSVEVTFTGTDLEEPEQLLFSHPGLKAEPLANPEPPAKPDPKQPRPRGRRGRGMGKPVVSRFKVTIANNVPLGIHDVRFVNKWGVSNPRAFVAGDLNEVLEKEPNNDVEQAQRVELNSTVNGAMANPTDVDYYVVAGKKGQRVVFSCLASSIDSRFHAGLEIYDSKGRQLTAGRDYNDHDAVTDCTLPDDGNYYVRLFQFTHTQGTAEYFYRLSISTAPWIDAVFPCAVEPGKTTSVTVYGRNLPGGKLDPSAIVGDCVLEKITANVTAPTNTDQRLAFNGQVTPKMAGLDGFEYRLRNASGSSNPFFLGLARAPVVLDNGKNDTPETAQEVRVPCEVAGYIEKQRDRDWYTFTAKKGDVYNIEIFSDRLGAPTYMYFMLKDDKRDLKESDDNQDILSRKFYARTEDPQAYRFVVPADGKYQLMVSSRLADTLAEPRHFYRIRIAPPKPDFHLVALATGEYRPAGTTILAGSQQAFTVLAIRQDGFVGDITLSAEGLPAGVTAAPQMVGGDLRESRMVVSAAKGAAVWTGEIKIVGTATIGGKKVVREARSASIVWPVQQNQNVPLISRVDRNLMLAVRPGAPYSVAVSLDKPMLVQGEKGTLSVKVTRFASDLKQPLSVRAITAELPKGLTLNNNQPVNIAANATDGKLSINVQNNVQPGTYTLVLYTQTQMPYNKDPMAKQKPNTPVALPSAPVTLTILPKSLAKLSLSTTNVNVKLNMQAEVVVRVQRQLGYDGEYKVQVVLPKGAQGAAIADTVIPAGKDEAKLIVKAGAKPGNMPNLIVRATAMYLGHATKDEVKFNVNVVK